MRQPPRSTADQDDLVTAVDIDDGDSDDDSGLALPAWLVAVLLAVLSVQIWLRRLAAASERRRLEED